MNTKEQENEVKVAKDLPEYEEFVDFKLEPELLETLYKLGYEKPSKIQKQCIQPLLDGRDMLLQAQAGTGKTVAYIIPILQKIDIKNPKPQVLILFPNRELAIATSNLIGQIGAKLNPKIQLLTGGINVREQIQDIQGGAQIICATPGRALDMVKRGFLEMEWISQFILDEADEILARGFQEQITEIFKYMPPKIQFSILTSTVPEEVKYFFQKRASNPLYIAQKNDQITLDGIRQYYVCIDKEKYRFEVLLDLYSVLDITQCVIFCNTPEKVIELTEQLKKNNHQAIAIVSSSDNKQIMSKYGYFHTFFSYTPITFLNFIINFKQHSQMNQYQIEEATKKFRSGEIRLAVFNGIGRQFDIAQISCSILYELPQKIETYFDKIGRSGRWGRKGVAISLIVPEDAKQLSQIEKNYNTIIDELPLDVTGLLD